MSFPAFFSFSRIKSRIWTSFSSWAFLAFGAILGVAAASQLVSGDTQLAFGLILILPAIVLIFKYPLLGVIVWLLLDPFLFTTTTSAGRMVFWLVHRALPPVAVGVLGITYLLRIRKFPRLGLTELAMLGYIGVSLFSIALLGRLPQPTAYQFYDSVISPMCLYFIIRLSAPGEKEMKQLLPVIFFLGATQAVIGILSWYAPQYLPQQWLLRLAGERTTGTLVSQNVYASTMVFAGLILLHAALNRKPDRIRALYLFVFFLSIFCIFLSFSRASWLAAIMVFLGVLCIYPKFTLRMAFLFVPAAVLFMNIFFADTIAYAKERLNETNTALSRLPVTLAAYRMFKAKPIFGWGYGNFDYYDRQFQGRVGELVNANQDLTSHNQYLTILAEQGIVGLTLFLAPVGLWLFESIKTRRSIPAEGFWSRKLLFLLWLVILDHFVENNFSQMWVGFGLGMWWLTLGLIANMIDRSAANDQWNNARIT